MATKRQTLGWSTWTLAFVLLLLIVVLGLVYLAY